MVAKRRGAGIAVALFRSMKNKLVPSLALCLALVTAGAGCGGGSAVGVDNIEDSTVTVVNESDFAITELYVTYAGSPSWGPNQLFGDALFPFEQIVLHGFPCDFYDVMLVAEDGVTCELRDIELCFDDAAWYITNDTCDEFFAKAEAAKAN